jgi:hypothetical protein
MNPVDAIIKSLVVEQSVALLFAAACLFGAAILGFTVKAGRVARHYATMMRRVTGRFLSQRPAPAWRTA